MMYSGGRGTGQDGLGTGEGPRAPRTSAQLCTNPDPLAAVSRASGRFPPWSVGHRGACRSLPLMSLLWASPASHVSRTLLLCLSDKRRLSGGSGTSNQREGGPGEKGTMSRVQGVAFVCRPLPPALGRPPLVPLLDEPCAPHSRATSVPSHSALSGVLAGAVVKATGRPHWKGRAWHGRLRTETGRCSRDPAPSADARGRLRCAHTRATVKEVSAPTPLSVHCQTSAVTQKRVFNRRTRSCFKRGQCLTKHHDLGSKGHCPRRKGHVTSRLREET